MERCLTCCLVMNNVPFPVAVFQPLRDDWTALVKSAVFLWRTNMQVEWLAIFQVLPFSELWSGKVRLKSDFIMCGVEVGFLKHHHIFKTES